MNFLRTGHFFGNTNGTITLGGITLTDTDTDTEQTQEHVDWHFTKTLILPLFWKAN